MKTLLGLIAGLLFGAGLVVSGMISPVVVLGFLDITGNWDPSLAFVMGGAILAAAPLFAIARRRRRPIAALAFNAPKSVQIDSRLITGAALFGVGWGLAGICPGPGVVNLAILPASAAAFLVPMIAGLVLSSRLKRQECAPGAMISV